MLPFLRDKRTPATMVVHKREGEAMSLPEQEHPLASAAEDLMHAIHSKDIQAVASALEAAYQLCESMESDEGSMK